MSSEGRTSSQLKLVLLHVRTVRTIRGGLKPSRGPHSFRSRTTTERSFDLSVSVAHGRRARRCSLIRQRPRHVIGSIVTSRQRRGGTQRNTVVESVLFLALRAELPTAALNWPSTLSHSCSSHLCPAVARAPEHTQTHRGTHSEHRFP